MSDLAKSTGLEDSSQELSGFEARLSQLEQDVAYTTGQNLAGLDEPTSQQPPVERLITVLRTMRNNIWLYTDDNEKPIPLSDEQRELVASNLDIVKMVIAQVAHGFPKHVDWDELESAGMLGLTDAAKKYDIQKGDFKFYAAQRIRGSILDAARAVDFAPRSVRSFERKLKAFEQRFIEEHKHSPSEEEIATGLGVERTVITKHKARHFGATLLSLDKPTEGDDQDSELTTGSRIKGSIGPQPEDFVEDKESLDELRSAINSLRERDRKIVIGYFFEMKPYSEIAEELGVTESRISQRMHEIIRSLRTKMHADFQPNTFGENS